MTTQFISRVEREIQSGGAAGIGPGAYDLTPNNIPLPTFAPFASTAKRMPQFSIQDGPEPGAYNIAENLLKKQGVSSVFKSTEKRFKPQTNDGNPAPGTYVLKSSFGVTRAPINRPATNPLDLIPVRSSSPPSIPAKSQAHGYEILPSGAVIPQPPIMPGFSGKAGDAVGPGDYNPSIDAKFRKAPKPVFSQVDRGAMDKLMARISEGPGPGYYDAPSDFDLNPTGHIIHDNDFLVQLHNARKRQTSCFESKTNRDAMLKEVDRRKDDPGPGQYELPSAIHVGSKPPNLQFFASCGPRFKDGQQSSMQVMIAPGKYNPLTSDFDRSKIRILKQKKMSSRSHWAQNIAFTSTETRFREDMYDSEVPAASAYSLKGLADTLPRQGVRDKPFNSSEARFKIPKPMSEDLSTHEILQRALNKEINQLLPPKPSSPYRTQSSPNPIHGTRPKFTSAFAPTPDNRLRPIKSPPGPPPGAYNLDVKWDDAAGVIPMAPPVVVCKKKPEKSPGPGTYVINRKFGSAARNPKNIMVSTGNRDERIRIRAPPPGYYDPQPLTGTFIKPSHNILLSDRY